MHAMPDLEGKIRITIWYTHSSSVQMKGRVPTTWKTTIIAFGENRRLEKQAGCAFANLHAVSLSGFDCPCHPDFGLVEAWGAGATGGTERRRQVVLW